MQESHQRVGAAPLPPPFGNIALFNRAASRASHLFALMELMSRENRAWSFRWAGVAYE